MSMTFDYSSNFDPVAPVIQIEVDGYNSDFESQSISALLDTGADVSAIPMNILEVVKAGFKETLWLRGVTGTRVQVDLYLVEIRIGPYKIPGIHAISIPTSDHAIIGRDVLNQLVTVLHGPGEQTTISR